MSRRWLAMARSGRFVVMRGPTGVVVVDAIGTAPRGAVAGDVVDFACVGPTLWVLDGARVRRFHLDGARPLEPAIELPAAATRIVATQGDNAHAALVTGTRPMLVHGLHDRTSCEAVDDVAPGSRIFPLHGRRVAIATTGAIRLVDVGRGEVGRVTVPDDGEVLDAVALFGGRAIATLIEADGNHAFVVMQPGGSLIHRVAVPRATRWAIAETRGLAVVALDERELITVDLRYGKVGAEGHAPLAMHDLAVDADGQYVALAGAAERPELAAPVLHLPWTEVFAPSTATRRSTAPGRADSAADDDRADDDRADDDRAGDDRDGAAVAVVAPVASLHGHTLLPPPITPALDAADVGAAPPDTGAEPEPAPPPIVVPELLPLGLGLPLAPMHTTARPDVAPYDSPRQHLDELLDLVAARAARAIADAWHTGRLSVPSDEARPFEREVAALLGKVGGFATDQLAEAEDRLAALSNRVGARAISTIAHGLRLPFIELCREFELSNVAAQIILIAMAPQVRGEIARLYGVLANDEHRALCDRYLVELILAGGDAGQRVEVARELADDAPLTRYGLIRVGDVVRGTSLFGALTVDKVLIQRLRDQHTPTSLGDITTVRRADRTLAELRIAPEIKRDLVLALAEPRGLADPVRIVLRGRRGAGRTSLIAALAARVDKGVSAIDCARMGRGGKQVAHSLRTELFRALIRSTVPVVSGLDAVDAADAEGQDALRTVLRTHPGPLVIRTHPEANIPLDPGYLTLALRALSETERVEVWADVAARRGLRARDVDGLASRYRIGPGIIEQVAATVVTRRGQDGVGHDEDASAQLDAAALQHIATRLGHVASHVTRLPKWEQVALPDDMLDSLREFIGRIRHRRTVYERWGYDSKMTTSRGLTALFYGPPGTGKSMVAGLIARELGLELYRVDLARIVSKWIGETEKNLAEVFDAAEDGQVVILFDEADSLFAKRTEVKTSVDRYANLEVNYLLQRLDSFEGIAILTTNLEGSIDPAFKRRMSLRLQFPFPDEEMRVRLWSAHVPPETPTAGDFDFSDLARRFPLSGGYIRNSALRAAFLAAQEAQPLGQHHLVRAIQLEYRELGKLSTTGRME